LGCLRVYFQLYKFLKRVINIRIAMEKTKIISIYDTSGFGVLKNACLENIRDLLENEDIVLREEKQPSVKSLEDSSAIIWAPFPQQIIEFGMFGITTNKHTLFTKIREEGFQGKRLLYLSEGFPRKADYYEMSEGTVFFAEDEDYSKIVGLIKRV